MSAIRFGPQVCGSLAEGAAREWLVADGAGGYAMGTVAGLRTRRYHALLVVAGTPVGARSVGLAAVDPVVVIGDRRVRLATHAWASGAVDPTGNTLLAAFALRDGVPCWQWWIDGVVIEREVAMAHGRPLVAIRHRVLHAQRPIRIELTPLCTWRDAHGERLGGDDPAVTVTADGFVFEGHYRVAGPAWQPGGTWYRGAYLAEEAARGLGALEDLWAAGCFSAELAPGDCADVVAAAAPFVGSLPDAGTVIDGARARARAVVRSAEGNDATDDLLALAADQFLVTTGDGPAVVAGYPWFGSWSRDTMTAYEGLLLDTNRADEGRMLLTHAAATLSEGMLPNTADTGDLRFNSVDATLWFVHALGRHVARTGDVDLAAALHDAAAGSIERHLAGTRFGIHADPVDTLLVQGAGGEALTWMDACVDGEPVTPRAGKAVDINALWINALGTMAGLARAQGRDDARWSGLHATATASFRAAFVRADGLGLLDVLDAPPQIRPNQLLALSLPHGPGGPRAVVDVCRSALLTPKGLRSLAPADPAYTGRHRGNAAARDRAYHQGTVWPWLLGPYVDAARRAGAGAAGALDGVGDELHERGLGSVSETADGDPPHDGTGCPFQAWSVAEVLRVRRLSPC